MSGTVADRASQGSDCAVSLKAEGKCFGACGGGTEVTMAAVKEMRDS